MDPMETPVGCSVVAVYPDHLSAEHALQKLHQAGFAMCDLSIVGRDLQTTEEPVGFVSASDYATAGAKTGASFGGLLGLLVGAAFLILPGIGPVLVAGPLAASLLAGIEGAIAGTALGSLTGALIGWGIPKEHALKYETHVKAGKFLVLVRGNPEVIAHARSLIDHHEPEHSQTFEPAVS
ncbi:MAG: general stress protein [Isosphaeraceae bacterium]